MKKTLEEIKAEAKVRYAKNSKAQKCVAAGMLRKAGMTEAEVADFLGIKPKELRTSLV